MTKVPKSVNDFVYAPSRKVPNTPPIVVYVPRPEMMLKMMRACIEVKDPDGLWVNLKVGKFNPGSHEFDGNKY